MAFCPWDERLFASAGEDETARVWRDDAEREGRGRNPGGGGAALISPHGVCRGHKDEVVRVAWHPRMRLLATGGAEGAVGVWRVAQPGDETPASAHDPDGGDVARVDTLGGHPEEVYGCAFVGDGAGGGPVLGTASGPDLHLWDLEASTLLSRVPPSDAGSTPTHPGEEVPERWRPGYLFSLSSDGGARGFLGAASSDGAVRLWGHDSTGRTATGVAAVAAHPSTMACATAFLSAGDVLASAGADGSVVLIDVRTMTPIKRVKAPCPLMGCCAVPTGGGGPSGWLAMCGTDGSVRVIDVSGVVAGVKVLKPPTGGPGEAEATPLLCVAADQNGRRIAAAGYAPTPPPEGGPGRPVGKMGALGQLGGFGAKKTPPAGINLWEALAE